MRTRLRRLAERMPQIKSLVEHRDALLRDKQELVTAYDALCQRTEGLDALVRQQGLWPPGHFYSPLPDADALLGHPARRPPAPRSLPGVDLRVADQLALASSLAGYAVDQPFSAEPDGSHRFYFENDWFGYADGLILSCLLRHFRPHRLIEIGSGFSSALTLDINDKYLENECRCTFIEPDPTRLRDLLRPEDNVELIEMPVQEVDASLFGTLTRGDILFVDSSHVSKTGSDVNHLLLNVVPQLEPGVLVHVHDIFWPFEYPDAWLREGRFWTEAYLLRALLVQNVQLRIVFFSSYLEVAHLATVEAEFPLWFRYRELHPAGSIWMQTC